MVSMMSTMLKPKSHLYDWYVDHSDVLILSKLFSYTLFR